MNITPSERIILSLLIHATPQSVDWHTILYMILKDLEIQNLGAIQANLSRILSSQQLYREYCLGCKAYTGNLSLEVVSHCPSCTSEQRSQGLYTQYFLHFLFGLETEGPARRALYQILYREGVIEGGL